MILMERLALHYYTPLQLFPPIYSQQHFRCDCYPSYLPNDCFSYSCMMVMMMMTMMNLYSLISQEVVLLLLLLHLPLLLQSQNEQSWWVYRIEISLSVLMLSWMVLHFVDHDYDDAAQKKIGKHYCYYYYCYHYHYH